MKSLFALLVLLGSMNLAKAQEYLVSSVSGKVYVDNKPLAAGDIIKMDGVLRSEKHDCALKIAEASNDEDILILFRNGHVFRRKPLTGAKEDELKDLTFGQFLKDYDTHKYLTIKAIFNWDEFLTEFKEDDNRSLVTEAEKIPFVPAYNLENKQRLVICVYHQKDSVNYDLKIAQDSLLIGSAFSKEFRQNKDLVLWKLKLATGNNAGAVYEEMSQNNTSTLKKDNQLADEIKALVALEKGDPKKAKSQYEQDIIAALYYAYGRLYLPSLRPLISAAVSN
jgi:hypothetical protein